jgi:hypothetical protein
MKDRERKEGKNEKHPKDDGRKEMDGIEESEFERMGKKWR